MDGPADPVRQTTRRSPDIHQMTPAKTEMANNPERINDMSADYENRNEFSSVTDLLNQNKAPRMDRPKEVDKKRRSNRLFSDLSSIHEHEHGGVGANISNPHT